MATGDITLALLFGERCRPASGSDPAQVLTAFTLFTDRVPPALQEPELGVDRRILFCAAVDRNGYLPTRNARFSALQGMDAAWNAAKCGNRHLFAERVGLATGRDTRTSLLQTYRRDRGGGMFAMPKDGPAPITIGGRHWGACRWPIPHKARSGLR